MVLIDMNSNNVCLHQLYYAYLYTLFKGIHVQKYTGPC